MFKNKTVLETKRGDKVFTMECDSPTTLTELIDVLCDFRASCVQLLTEQVKMQDAETQKMVRLEQPEESLKESNE